MKPDDVLEYSSGVPLIARRATSPFAIGRRNRLAEPSTYRQMQFGYAVIHRATAG
jgi:hypothetical protein